MLILIAIRIEMMILVVVYISGYVLIYLEGAFFFTNILHVHVPVRSFIVVHHRLSFLAGISLVVYKQPPHHVHYIDNL